MSYTDLRANYLAEWRIWYKMIYSCKKNLDYYVETRVCDEWQGPQGFINWFDELGPRPGNGYVLDRINKLGDYEPGNVEWTTKSKSAARKRCHIDPESMAYWKNIAIQNGIKRNTFYSRVRDRGWTLQDAALIPIDTKKYFKRIV